VWELAETLGIRATRIEWGPAVAGAFCAVAVTIVLGLFGAAFGFGARSSGSLGLGVLAGIWEILTPLVATFCGAALATAIVGRRAAYVTSFMVWCLSVAFGALLVGSLGSLGATSATLQALMASGSGAALAGLAAILGLVGALTGAAVTSAAMERRIGAIEAKALAGGYREIHREAVQTPVTGEVGQRAPAQAEPPELRH
jgi:hypothetical protein